MRPICSWSGELWPIATSFFNKTHFLQLLINDEAQSQVVGTFTRACRVSGSHAKGKVKDSYGGRVGFFLSNHLPIFLLLSFQIDNLGFVSASHAKGKVKAMAI